MDLGQNNHLKWGVSSSKPPGFTEESWGRAIILSISRSVRPSQVLCKMGSQEGFIGSTWLESGTGEQK